MSEANKLIKLTQQDAVENGKIVRSTIFRCMIGSNVSVANGLTKLTPSDAVENRKIVRSTIFRRRGRRSDDRKTEKDRVRKIG